MALPTPKSERKIINYTLYYSPNYETQAFERIGDFPTCDQAQDSIPEPSAHEVGEFEDLNKRRITIQSEPDGSCLLLYNVAAYRISPNYET